jgi:hypothetical protein
MTNDELLTNTIKQYKGKYPPIVSVVAVETDKIAYELIGYDGEMAVVKTSMGGTKMFPARDIFDVNAVKKSAVKQAQANMQKFINKRNAQQRRN